MTACTSNDTRNISGVYVNFVFLLNSILKPLNMYILLTEKYTYKQLYIFEYIVDFYIMIATHIC